MSDLDKKKFYWLKLKKDFFQRHDIRIIESLPNGKDYLLFYLKLMCESTSHEGELRFSKYIPYSEEMLSTITNTNIDIVRQAIKYLTELKLVEILDDGTIYLQEVEKMVGCETGNAEKMRRLRASRKKEQSVTLLQNVTKCHQDIDIDKELDKEIDINKKTKHKYGEFNHVLLTDDELEKLKKEYPNDFDGIIKYLDEAIEMKGYKYKSHYMAIKKWGADGYIKSKNQGFNGRLKEEAIPVYDSKNNPIF